MGVSGRKVGSPRHKGYRAVGAIDKRRPERRQIAISFDEELFDEIADRAAKKNVSFSSLVQLWCEWGLETDATSEVA